MDKSTRIKNAFTDAIGKKIVSYATAEIFFADENRWDPWPDLPIRLSLGDGSLISVSWSRFDDLWLSRDASLPFSTDGSRVRWVENAHAEINDILGGTILSVSLGADDMTWGGEDIEILIHLIIATDRGMLDIFNALDESGYQYLRDMPERVIHCV